MNAPTNPMGMPSSNKSLVPMATDTNKRMGFNNFLRDVQGAMPTKPYVAPQMPTSMPQMAASNPFMPQQQPMMPPSSQSLRGGIGMPMQPVQGFDNGGVAEDPIFAAQRANNERARAEQEALAAYMASRATAGPTPLEIARAGYLADQGSTPDMPTTLAEPVQAPMQTMDIGEPTFSGGSPVADTGGISAVVPDPVALPTAPVINTFTPTQPTFSTGSPLPMENPNEEPVSTLTPMQQLAQALQDKIEDVGFDTYKKRDGEYNVRFDDGTSKFDKDLLDQFGVNKEDFLGALRGYGNYIGPVGTRQSAGAGFKKGLENILNPEEAQESYASELAAERAEKNKDERDAVNFARAQNASNLAKDAQGNILPGQSKSLADIKADLQAAGTDLAARPGMLMDDLSKLGSSVSQGFGDLTSGISDLFTGGDDTPSGDPSIPPYLTMNQPIIGGGVIPELPLGPEDFAPYPLGGGADNNPNQNFGSDTAPNITSDLISLGDSGVGGGLPNISGIGNAPVLPTEDSMAFPYYPNNAPSSSADYFNKGLPSFDNYSYPFDLSGLPRTPQSLYPSDTLEGIAGDEGPILNEQDLQRMYDNYEISPGDYGDLNRLGPENFAPYPEQSGVLNPYTSKTQLDDADETMRLLEASMEGTGSGVSDPYTIGRFLNDAGLSVGAGAAEGLGYKTKGFGDLGDQVVDAVNLNDVRGSTLEGDLQNVMPSQFGREGDIEAAIQNALGATTGRLGDSNNPDFVPSSIVADTVDPLGDYFLNKQDEFEAAVSEEGRKAIADNIATGDIKFSENGIPIGIENFSLGKDPSVFGTVLQALQGVGDLMTDAPLILLGPGGVTAALGLNVSEASGASADSIEQRIAEMAEPTRDNMYGSMTGRNELEKLDFYQNALAATGDPEIAKQQTIAKAKEGLLRTGLIEGGLETVATAMAVNPAVMMKGLTGGSPNKIAAAVFSATGAVLGEAASESSGQVSENISMQNVDPSVLAGDDALAAAIAGAKEGSGTSAAGLALQATRPSGSGVQTGVDPSSATGQLLSGEAQTELQDQINELSVSSDPTSESLTLQDVTPAETELQNEIDGLSKSEEIGLANEVLLDAGLDSELIDPVLREAGVIQNPPDQISSLTPISEVPSSLRSDNTSLNEGQGSSIIGEAVLGTGEGQDGIGTGSLSNVRFATAGQFDQRKENPEVSSNYANYQRNAAGFRVIQNRDGSNTITHSHMDVRDTVGREGYIGGAVQIAAGASQEDKQAAAARAKEISDNAYNKLNESPILDVIKDKSGLNTNFGQSTRTPQSEINTGADINNELDNLANDETNTQSDGDNEAQVLSDANSSTDITNIVNTDTDTNIDTTPVVVSDPVVTTTPVIPPAEEEVVVEEDPVVEEEIQQAIANLSGDPDTAKSKQERRDYSRLREIIEQRARAPRGTAPGLGYKPVEGISNTLGKDSNNFDTLLGITRSQGFNEGGPVPSTLDKAADDFLNALRFG